MDYHEAFVLKGRTRVGPAGRILTWTYYPSGDDSQGCSGSIECDVPVIILVLAILAALILLFLGGFFIYKRVKYRKAFEAGEVPGQMLISGYLRHSSAAGKEEPDKFVFRVQRKTRAADNQAGMVKEGDTSREVEHVDCPVCLKGWEAVKHWIVLQCSHELCERCFFRIVSRNRLHSTCPLCRQYLAEGAGCRGPNNVSNPDVLQVVTHQRSIELENMEQSH
jgi:hypothetical protein